jgi:hypothetical protein
MFAASYWNPHSARWGLAHQPTKSLTRIAPMQNQHVFSNDKEATDILPERTVIQVLLLRRSDTLSCDIVVRYQRKHNFVFKTKQCDKVVAVVSPDNTRQFWLKSIYITQKRVTSIYINIGNYIQRIALWQYFTWRLVSALNVGHHARTRKYIKKINLPNVGDLPPLP